MKAHTHNMTRNHWPTTPMAWPRPRCWWPTTPTPTRQKKRPSHSKEKIEKKKKRIWVKILRWWMNGVGLRRWVRRMINQVNDSVWVGNGWLNTELRWGCWMKGAGLQRWVRRMMNRSWRKIGKIDTDKIAIFLLFQWFLLK